MKRGIITALLIILLISSFAFVVAQKENAEDDDPDDNLDIAVKAEEAGEGIKAATEKTLDQEIILPEWLDKPVKVLFHIKDETITLERLIVLLAIFVGLLLVISDILKLVPFFKKTWQSFLGGVIVTIIIAVTGVVNNIVRFIFDFVNIFDWLNKMGPLKIIFGLVVAIILIIIAKIVLKVINHKMMLSKAEHHGIRAAAGMRRAEVFEETSEDLA